MTRWLRELINPALKCERVGHVGLNETRRFYQYPAYWSWRHIADRVTEERTVCSRCKVELAEWEQISSQGLSGLTIDSERMDKLHSEGRVYL